VPSGSPARDVRHNLEGTQPVEVAPLDRSSLACSPTELSERVGYFVQLEFVAG
jgi:hypothetical protein